VGERLARRHVAPRPFTEQDLHPLGHRCVTRGVGGFTQDVESFVVMMLDVDFAELKAEMARYLPLGLVIGVIVLIQLMFAFGVWDYSAGYEGRLAAEFGAGTNTGELGVILYDDYILIFQLAGLVLLVAMIGAIVLTLRHRVDVKRQDVVAQMMRDPAKAMELKDVKPGQGL